MPVTKQLEEGRDALPSRRLRAKESADLMPTIMNQSADSAFKCAAQVMKKIK